MYAVPPRVPLRWLGPTGPVPLVASRPLPNLSLLSARYSDGSGHKPFGLSYRIFATITRFS